MSFPRAISTVFGRDLASRGRASRSEFWWFWLFYLLVVVGCSLILPALPNSPPSGLFVGVTLIAIPALFLNLLAAGIRRLHDTGRSGWWWLISFIPFGSIVLLVFLSIEGNGEWNQYGPPPGVDRMETPSATAMPPAPA
jgi:uncharacterized membrane protein YhaH (DUF805 family)